MNGEHPSKRDPYEALYKTGKRSKPQREAVFCLIGVIVITVILTAAAFIVPMLLRDAEPEPQAAHDDPVPQIAVTEREDI